MEPDNSSLKKCNYCGEAVPADAGRCPYCGSILPTAEVAAAPETGDEHAAGDNQIPQNLPDGYREYRKPPLGNGMKVFLTILFTMIPGLGQLAGIITAIVFMNADDDADRKSFGVAILVASLIMFVISCLGCFIAAVSLSTFQNGFKDFSY